MTKAKYPYPDNDGQTHYPGCFREPHHHNCAVAMVERLAELVERLADDLGDDNYARQLSEDAETVLREVMDGDLAELTKIGQEMGGYDVISDGFGGCWSAWCPECKKKSMQIVRPGKVQCDECG